MEKDTTCDKRKIKMAGQKIEMRTCSDWKVIEREREKGPWVELTERKRMIKKKKRKWMKENHRSGLTVKRESEGMT